ncbi:MAG: hypothetical protein Q7S45_01345 [Candidatus Curtissbacteria bacterium]|nr:hypothetical protein [Candidatus Curtissbacteria bacterium]
MKLPALSNLRTGYSENFSRFAKAVVPAGVIAVSILVLIFVVWPKFGDVLSLRNVNNDLAARAQKLEGKTQRLSGYDKSQLESQLGYSEALLPSDKEVFPLVAQIERAVGASGVVLNKVDASPGSVGNVSIPGTTNASPANLPGTVQTPADTAAGNTPKVQVKVSLSSDYKSFLQFLNNVLAFSRVLVIRDLTLSSVGGTGQTTGQIKTLITIDAYYQLLPKELSSIEAPIDDLTQSEIKRLNQVKASGTSGPPTIAPVQGGRSDLFAPF